MNILSIDTTLKVASVCAKTNNNIYTLSDTNEITHSEKLLPLINTVIKKSNAQNIDLLITTNGPGSFTGCRIGIATVKGLAHVNNTDIIAIPSLELMAFETYIQLNTNEEKYICSILDARNNRVYYCLYKISSINNKIAITRITDISNEDINYVLDVLASYNYVIFSGDCINKFTDCIADYNKKNDLNYSSLDSNILPEAQYLIDYYEKVDTSDKHYTYSNLDIVYARVSQAERIKNEK